MARSFFCFIDAGKPPGVAYTFDNLQKIFLTETTESVKILPFLTVESILYLILKRLLNHPGPHEKVVVHNWAILP